MKIAKAKGSQAQTKSVTSEARFSAAKVYKWHLIYPPFDKITVSFFGKEHLIECHRSI